MRLAETVRGHWFLALASVAFVGSAVAVVATCPEKETISVTKSKTRPTGACGGFAKRAMPKAMPKAINKPEVVPAAKPEKATGAEYRRVLHAKRPELSRCMTSVPANVAYRVTASVVPDGRVASVEVRAEAADISKVDLKVVACVERVLSPVAFPTNDHDVRVSLRLGRSE